MNVCWNHGGIGKCKDLNNKGQIVKARWRSQNISKMTSLVGSSRYAVVSTYQKWSKEGQLETADTVIGAQCAWMCVESKV